MLPTPDTSGPRPTARRLEIPDLHHRTSDAGLSADLWAAAACGDVDYARDMLLEAYGTEHEDDLAMLPPFYAMTAVEVVAEPDDILGSYLRGYGTFNGPAWSETRARIASIQEAHGRCAEDCPGWAIWENGDPEVEPEVERCEGCLSVADGSVWPVTEEDVQALPEAIDAMWAAAAELRRRNAPDAHTRDEDCTVSEATGCCTGCGVAHSDPCHACGGCGYHLDGCEEIESDPPWPIATPGAGARS